MCIRDSHRASALVANAPRRHVQVFYQAVGGTEQINALEFALIDDPELKRIVENFTVFTDVFGRIYGEAWVKLMNADRFDGPLDNLCTMEGMEIA